MRHEAVLASSLKPTGALKPTAAPSGFDGIWRNELMSTMDLSVNGSAVTGEYTSKKSLTPGGGEAKGDIVGFVDDDIISIVVKWREATGSLTSWVGQVVTKDGKDSIETLWHLIRNVDEGSEPDYAWASILAGADTFHR